MLRIQPEVAGASLVPFLSESPLVRTGLNGHKRLSDVCHSEMVLCPMWLHGYCMDVSKQPIQCAGEKSLVAPENWMNSSPIHILLELETILDM